MVDSLAARLAAHPNDPSGWVRLVRAYGVLGQSAKQAAALERARSLFAGRPDVLGELVAAARPRS
jgi:cytochrome c-type biogenesis protein CcmH